MLKKMKEKEHAHSDVSVNREHERNTTFICPVCKKPLHEDNLVDMKSVVEDNLYYVGGVRIMNFRVPLACDFQHHFDKEEVTIDEPHKLVAVVNAEFDELGECVHFEIKEILAG